MKNQRKFLERMSEIDDDLLMRADDSAIAKKKSGSRMRWIIISAAALCLVIAASITAVIFATRGRAENESDLDDVLQVPIDDVYWVDNREQNKNQVLTQNLAIVWPWNCRDFYNQYTEISLNGATYRSRSFYYGGEVYANQIGEKISDTEVRGYDELASITNDEGIYHTIQCEVFEIVGVDSSRIVAVKYEGYDGYYAFMNDEYDMPETIGDLIDRLDLTNNIKLNSFYYDSDGDRRDEHYALNDEASNQLWEIIKKYSSAPSVSDDIANWSESRLSFALDSSALGVYNLSFSFKEDGYLTTNVENYGYTYNLGREAIDEIVNFAIKNRLVILLPEKQYLVGTVTEIGEDYIKVNDSVLMKNPADGIEFTVYATNMNIRRYIISGYLKVGDTVSIEHGYLLKDSYTEIRNAVDLNECRITSNGQVLIPE